MLQNQPILSKENQQKVKARKKNIAQRKSSTPILQNEVANTKIPLK